MNDIAPLQAPGRRPVARQDPIVAALVAGMTDPFLVIDHRQRVRGWNPAAAALLRLEGAREGMRLVRVLGCAARLDAAERATVAARAEAALAGAEDGREEPGPLGLRLRRLGARRWMLGFATGEAGDSGLDALTGLPNRRALQAALAGIASHMAAGIGGPALLLLGLDRFRTVNDRLGHAVGDALLVAVAKRLRAALRGTDTVYRLGSDEFAVVMASPDQAQAQAERLVELLGRSFLIQGQVCAIGAGVGLARAPQDGQTGEELLRCAELALSQAKAQGRNCVRAYDHALDERVRARHAIEADLRLAMVRNQLELHYQAQVDLATGALAGFEALLRWHHPERGPVPPDVFIPIAEEIGLIVQIGEWVMRTACRDCAGWPAPLSVAVNISPLQLAASERLLAAVKAALAASGLAPERLEIEITESALLRDQEGSRATLMRLRAIGARISMDDFGTGYSSLSQLRSFPFDKIKIDRSFVADMAVSSEAVAVVRAVTSLGQCLGMTTTAEGVETDEQAHRLGMEGCTYLQGYLISRPLPLGQLPALIARYPLPPAHPAKSAT